MATEPQYWRRKARVLGIASTVFPTSWGIDKQSAVATYIGLPTPYALAASWSTQVLASILPVAF